MRRRAAALRRHRELPFAIRNPARAVLGRRASMQPSIDHVPLRAGAHPSRDDGVCAMEMVAWLAGESHSDEPRCACPVVGALVRACNDAMNDTQRNRYLRPLVPMLVGTRGSAATERARGWLVVDTVVRTLLPLRLRRERRNEEADLLSGLPALERRDDARTALRAVEHFALRQHAARWVLQRAVDGDAPARYVAGAVQVARTLHDGSVWPLMAALVERMALLRDEPAAALANR
jgi:hypothetical protein